MFNLLKTLGPGSQQTKAQIASQSPKLAQSTKLASKAQNWLPKPGLWEPILGFGSYFSALGANFSALGANFGLWEANFGPILNFGKPVFGPKPKLAPKAQQNWLPKLNSQSPKIGFQSTKLASKAQNRPEAQNWPKNWLFKEIASQSPKLAPKAQVGFRSPNCLPKPKMLPKPKLGFQTPKLALWLQHNSKNNSPATPPPLPLASPLPKMKNIVPKKTRSKLSVKTFRSKRFGQNVSVKTFRSERYWDPSPTQLYKP